MTAGPHADIVTKAAEVAKQKGLTVEVVEFTDYISPDRSLADGALDAVVYQHEPFLQNFNKVNKTDLRVVGKAVVQPMGCYSKTIKSVAEIPEGSVVAIPPTSSKIRRTSKFWKWKPLNFRAASTTPPWR